MASQTPVLLGSTAASEGEKMSIKHGDPGASTREESSQQGPECWFGCFASSEDLSQAIAINHQERYVMEDVTTLNLCSGWNGKMQLSFQAAVQKVVDENPILAGKFVRSHGDVCVLPGVHKKLADFMSVKKGPSDLMVPSGNVERIKFLQEVLMPYFETASIGFQHLAAGSPIFRVEVLTLPDSFACIAVSSSHMLTDGAGHHRILAMISDALNGKEITPMRWEKVEQPWWGKLPMTLMIGSFAARLLASVVKSKLNLTKNTQARAFNSFLLDAENISKLKTSLKGDSAFVSTNDIVVAALAEMLDRSAVLIPKNMRSPDQSNLGGNQLEHVIGPLEKCAGDPAAVRKLVETGATPGFQAFWPCALVDFASVTNWCFGVRLEGGGLVSECMIPRIAECDESVAPVAVIFSPQKNATAIQHNLNLERFTAQLESEGSLLSQIINA